MSQPTAVDTVLIFLYGIAVFSIAFSLLAALLAPSILKKRKSRTDFYPPVTILKPLKGDEPGLAENLESFSSLDYPLFQIILTIKNPDDTATPIARKIKEKFPEKDIEIVFSQGNSLEGPNPKINNVSSAQPFIKYPLLMMADSDVRVQKDFLKRMVDPLSDPQIGLVTSFYQGSQSRKFWPTMEALSINAYFLPQAMAAYSFGMRFAMGAAMLIRKDVFEKIGGFEYLSRHLADDFVLGEAVKALGLQIAAASCLVECVTEDSGFLKYLKHQIRWAHTIRTCRASGYLGLLFLHGFSLLILSLFLFGPSSNALMLMTAVVLSKFLAQQRILSASGEKPNWRSFFLLPLNELVIFFAWAYGWRNQSISWRGETYSFPETVDAPALVAAER